MASPLINLNSASLTASSAAASAFFNSLQEEAKHKEATTRIETELAQRKVELEQMEAKKKIEMARAKLKVYKEDEFEDEID